MNPDGLEPAKAGPTMEEFEIAGHSKRKHGSRCSCRLLAEAIGEEPSELDYGFCRRVLQKRWRMTCDHIPRARREKTTPKLPPHDSRDPIHGLLLANAGLSAD